MPLAGSLSFRHVHVSIVKELGHICQFVFLALELRRQTYIRRRVNGAIDKNSFSLCSLKDNHIKYGVPHAHLLLLLIPI